LSGHNFRIERRSRSGEDLRLRDGIDQRIRRAFQITSLVFVRIGDGLQHPFESRPPELIIGREIRPAKKWFAVGQQKSRQRPSTLARKRADRRLISRIHVGPFVAIDFHRHEIFVDDSRNFRVLVTLAVNDVAPVTPHRADIEQYRFVFRFCARENVFIPFMPVDGLVRRGAQVRAGGIFQSILRMFGQRNPFDNSEVRADCLFAGGVLGDLLHNIARAQIARVKRLAPGEAFVLAMIKTDAIFSETPAQINILIINA
jgi:hypothetical protein